MRKIALWLAILSLTACFCGCSSGSKRGGSGEDKELEQVEDFTKYDLDVYMKPIWSGEIVYNETVMLVGKGDYAPLLYPATEILSVRSYDLQKEYVRGVDYEYDKELGAIIRGSDAIPYIPTQVYYPSRAIEGKTFPCTAEDRAYIAFAEGSYFSSNQIAVTYRHGGQVCVEKPNCQKEAFSSTLAKLQNNEPVKILFYGDSITVGANSSGFVDYAPHADIWSKMVFDSLVKKYGATNAEYVNTAVGGWTSQNGIDNLEKKVLAHNADAVFIGFGMNDGSLSPSTHAWQIKKMIDVIKERNPNVEICLVSTMLPNQEVKGFYREQYAFEAEYKKLIAEYQSRGDTKICLAPVTSMHQAILEKKRYYDMTGNNVNHPNDFMARVYAQTVFQTVCGYED
ncbi:MAG: SGNH/GDSL hydrolase family protein [Clostridia bacterium]|nr:SGNH/GDSL hydrolase family protein [Clostridia bacterium]